jgi:hypothetical protein
MAMVIVLLGSAAVAYTLSVAWGPLNLGDVARDTLKEVPRNFFGGFILCEASALVRLRMLPPRSAP